jgi:hypothetical protein
LSALFEKLFGKLFERLLNELFETPLPDSALDGGG